MAFAVNARHYGLAVELLHPAKEAALTEGEKTTVEWVKSLTEGRINPRVLEATWNAPERRYQGAKKTKQELQK
jgi:hypothetical protein